MTYCDGCGRPTMPDESGLCGACLAADWREFRTRVNLWDVDRLRASMGDRPLPKASRHTSAQAAGRTRRS